MDKSEKAKERFCSGCNCAQAVLGAFCGELGLDEEQAMMLSSSFGGGMGRMGEVCGALCGAFMVAGLKKGYTPETRDRKAEHYQRVRDMAAAFRAENGSIVCRELLAGVEGHPRKASCAELVALAARLADEV